MRNLPQIQLHTVCLISSFPSDSGSLSYTGVSVPLSSQPRHMSTWHRGADSEGVAIVTVKDITLVAGNVVASATPTAYEGQCVGEIKLLMLH